MIHWETKIWQIRWIPPILGQQLVHGSLLPVPVSGHYVVRILVAEHWVRASSLLLSTGPAKYLPCVPLKFLQDESNSTLTTCSMQNPAKINQFISYAWTFLYALQPQKFFWEFQTIVMESSANTISHWWCNSSLTHPFLFLLWFQSSVLSNLYFWEARMEFEVQAPEMVKLAVVTIPAMAWMPFCKQTSQVGCIYCGFSSLLQVSNTGFSTFCPPQNQHSKFCINQVQLKLHAIGFLPHKFE